LDEFCGVPRIINHMQAAMLLIPTDQNFDLRPTWHLGSAPTLEGVLSPSKEPEQTTSLRDAASVRAHYNVVRSIILI
jgi:hypothetical protein